MCFETVDTNTHTPGSELLQGLKGERSLKQDTVGFLFCLLLFHWRFPIYLSDQVIEDLREREERRERESLQTEGLTGCSPSELIITYMSEKPLCVLNKYNSTDDCSTHIHL